MRALLIVPPFGTLDRPSLGIHVVQAYARKHGHQVDVFYSNIVFAARIGEVAYMAITTFGGVDMLGERVMGLSLGASIPDRMLDELNRKIAKEARARDLQSCVLDMRAIESSIDDWLADVASVVRDSPYDVIGFSTTFEQTNGLAVLAKTCRDLLPDVKLVAGGANCEGEMAAAVSDYVPELDVVFSGESEIAFSRYLDGLEDRKERRIVHSPPKSDLNDNPCPDFSDFFRQIHHWLPDAELIRAGDLRISYETSRGCWWGQKHHCTFCGLNGGGMGYREKDPVKVIAELAELAKETGIRKFEMTDNIMPHSYFGTLVPMLKEADLGIEVFYEQKANISLEKIVALKAAGIIRIQPGIESLNDDLLKLMKKGTSSKQNIAMLRYSRVLGVDVLWNILSGFPGEQEEWFEETLRMVPSLVHLQPPTSLYTLNFDRFSPYHERPAYYGIEDLKPHLSYAEAFPNCANLDDLAYHFRGLSNSLKVGQDEVLIKLSAKLEWWKSLWGRPEEGRTPPCLEIIQLDERNYMMIDTRPLSGILPLQQITEEQASVALCFHQAESAATRWGEDNFVCFRVAGGFIPLACAAPRIIQHFESVRAPDLADVAV